MIMQVQTYEVEEITNELGVMAADSEAAEIIEKLGLAGQKSLLNAQTVTRWPYRRITEIESLVFRATCPMITPLCSYASGTIPLRVLQIAQTAMESGFVKSLEVWHPEDVRTDPILIARVRDVRPKYEWNDFQHLLARWGTELEPLTKLAVKAKAFYESKAQEDTRNIANDLSAKLTKLALA